MKEDNYCSIDVIEKLFVGGATNWLSSQILAS
jgi:hypothetical protein